MLAILPCLESDYLSPIGIVWSFFHLPMPAILDRSLNIATSMTAPAPGPDLHRWQPLDRLRGDIWKAALATTIKLILLPIVTAGFMIFFNVSGLDFAIGLLMAEAIVILAMVCSSLSYMVLLFWLH